MKLRVLALSCFLLVSAALLLPAASAQGLPQGTLRFTISFEHDSMPIPVDGRADMPVHVKLEAENFVCAEPWKFSVDVKAHPFAKWAGASLEPPKVAFTINQGQPGLQNKVPYQQDTVLNLAWDVESAPKQNAKQDYILVTAAVRDDPTTRRSCAPSFREVHEASPPMTATLPDRTQDNQTVSEVGCDVDPFQARCQAAVPEAVEESAGLDTAVFLAALAVVMIRVRRRAA